MGNIIGQIDIVDDVVVTKRKKDSPRQSGQLRGSKADVVVVSVFETRKVFLAHLAKTKQVVNRSYLIDSIICIQNGRIQPK